METFRYSSIPDFIPKIISVIIPLLSHYSDIIHYPHIIPGEILRPRNRVSPSPPVPIDFP